MLVAHPELVTSTRLCRLCPSSATTRLLLTRRPRVWRRSRFAASNSGTDETGGSPVVRKGETQLRQTVADLDAILGIEEEDEEQEEAETKTEEALASLSPAVEQEIRSLAEEATKKLNEEESSTADEGKEKEFIEKMTDVVKKATSLAEGKEDEKGLLESLEALLQSTSSTTDKSQEDVQIMKERVFGADTFWVTDVVVPNDAFGGHRFRGNMRGSSEKTSFLEVESKIKELFGDQYEVLMFEEPLTPDQMSEPNPKPKVCFQIVPSELARPPKSPSWRPVAVGVLFLFTVATSYILGVSSNAGNIPAPIVEYLSQPENLNAAEWPEFVRSWNPSTFLASSATVGAGVMFLQLAHEGGHRVMAFLKKIKVKGSLLLPNTQIGTLGSSTQLDSLVKDRQDLWDFAFGGLAAGGVASLTLFIAGLVLLQDGSIPKEALIPVPSVLLQGSSLIGGLLQLVLGEAAKQRTVLLHPFTIAGWCGLTTTALNALPVGNLDGGRMMLSAFGRRTLSISSVFTYAGLGLGIIGSSLALPFGLYVLICEREPETYLQNQVTPTERNRQWITGISIAVAVLVLLPMGLFDANDAAVGPGGSLF